MKSQNPDCPCGSGQRYAVCCRPFHRGEEPPTPTALMRSRYAAFALGEVGYLWRTLHPAHPDRAQGEASFTASIRQGRAVLRFARLRVLDADSSEDGLRGRVLFHAEIYERGKERSFAELSSFEKTEDGWRYRSGENRPLPASSPGLAELRICSLS